MAKCMFLRYLSNTLTSDMPNTLGVSLLQTENADQNMLSLLQDALG